MKPMFESEEVFMAYAKIDYCYYMIEELAKEKIKPRSPIASMIDKAVGYDPYKTKEKIDTTESLLEEIIKSKKIIEADYSGDERALIEIKNLISNPH